MAFLPQWYRNPYQRLLDEHLGKLGVRVLRFRQTPVSIMSSLGRCRPHIVHLHWLHPFFETPSKQASRLRLAASMAGLRFLERTGTSIVWTAHNLSHHDPTSPALDRRWTEFVARRSAQIIVHGPSARDRLLSEFCGLDPDRITVIPHGHFIDCYENRLDRHASRQRLNLPDDAVVFLLFGQIRANKGVIELVDAFQRLRHPGAWLLIVGRPHPESFDNQVKRAVSGADHIRYLPGFVPDEQVQVYMNGADAVVLPYRDILTSGAAVLAMSFSRSCIVPEFGCFLDVLDQEGAFYYHPRDPNGLQNALRLAIDQQADLARRGEHNRRRAYRWDWPSIARQTQEVYRRALRV